MNGVVQLKDTIRKKRRGDGNLATNNENSALLISHSPLIFVFLNG